MDAAFTEIMKNRFGAIAEEASTVAYRTAHTTFVKQTQDFQVALARPTGEFFAFPTMTGVTSAVCQNVAAYAAPFLDAFEPGDILITNDPHRTKGLVTHTMDIHLLRPVFVGEELVAFAWAFVHASDIGGAVPGSISPELSEVYQEGIQLRPVKLRSGGRLNREIVDILHDNSRIGSEIWGDLEAMQSAMRLLDRRLNELCAKVGLDTMKRGIDAVMNHAEAKARAVISRLTDGSWSFSDYLEGNGPDEAVHIRCSLTIDGDEAHIDYSGSDPQVHAALNFATGDRPHPFLSLALTNYINTVDPATPVNGGIIRPIHARAPSGTLMNATHPAAMGNRWVAVMRTYDALMGCLNQAVPGGLAACGAGQAGIISAAWADAASGAPRVAVVEPFSGGSGGRARMDGVDANDTMIGYLKSTPVEDVEIDVPLIVREHALVPDSFGHGTFRGGASVAIELEATAPEVAITVRGLDRFRFRPWGYAGGLPGRAGETAQIVDGKPSPLGRIRIVRLARGERLRMTSPSGGGFGPPLGRDPARVIDEVRNGLLSPAVARKIYGIVFDGDRLDEEATLERRVACATNESFTHVLCEVRQAYERRIPPEVSSALALAVLDSPAGLRRFVFASVHSALASGHLQASPSAVEHAVRQMVERAGMPDHRTDEPTP